MSKRKAVSDLDTCPVSKAARFGSDHLSILSDELLLRIFLYIPVETLATCHRVSRRLKAIAGDAELWKAAYHERFIMPKVLRHFAGKRRTARLQSNLGKWLDEQDLVRAGQKTNWKRQYKIRSNWAKGSCDLSEICVASRPATAAPLARLHAGIVFSVDRTSGLRAWSYKGQHRLLASLRWHVGSVEDGQNQPTALGLDTQEPPNNKQTWIVIGFESGAFGICKYTRSLEQFQQVYSHPPSTNGTLSAVSFSRPYLLTVNANNILSVYKFVGLEDSEAPSVLGPPLLLASLKSHTMWPPLALGLRVQRPNVIASVAYCSPMYLSGWSTGIQELVLTPDGNVLESRLASAVLQGFASIAQPGNIMATHRAGLGIKPLQAKPTSLSYAHPYLLVSNSDNTLTVHMVTSTTAGLSLSAGRRLWGHTSSIFGAQIGARGKAVSVSLQGNEVRVWELEGGRTLSREQDQLPLVQSGIRVTPERPVIPEPSRLDQADQSRADKSSIISQNEWRVAPQSTSFFPKSAGDLTITKDFGGFDDENVVVLREQHLGDQTLMVYDFTR